MKISDESRERLFALRRTLLKTLVPEFVWPRTVAIPGGGEFPVRGMDFSFGVKRSLSRGIYESEERDLVSRLAQPGIHVIEMGASIGFVTSLLAEGVGADGRVVSVEGSGRLASGLKEWLPSKYPWVTIVHGVAVPVWDGAGLKVLGFDDSGASLGGRAALSAGAESEGLSALDLKTLCSSHNVEPSLLVVDIEGSEAMVPDTPPQLPDMIRDVVLELHPGLYAKPETEEAIIAAYGAEGFEVMEYRNAVVHLHRE